jgi:predicted transcriptional regulator
MSVQEGKESKTLNSQLANFIKSDREFVDGIKRGVKDCKAGRVQLWSEVKKELNIR